MTDRMSAADYRAATQAKQPSNKFGAKRVSADGESFDSKAEHRHHEALKRRLRLGEIYALSRQPKFPLIVEGEFIGEYRADFAFWDLIEDRFRVQDVKGVVTRDFKRTCKIIKALYAIDVEVVKA